MSFLKKKIK